MKNSFILYTEYEEKLKILTDEQLGKLLRAIFQYEKNDELTMELEPIVQLAFGFIAGDLDRANQKYTESVESGKKGGAPKGNSNALKTTSENENNLKQGSIEKNNPKQPKTTLEEKKQGSAKKNNLNDNDNDNVNVDDNVNDNDKEYVMCHSGTVTSENGLDEHTLQTGESLKVEMAGGTDNSVDHSTTLFDKRFSEFWEAYPKKVGKKDAMKAFKAAKVTDELHKRIIAAVEVNKQSEQWNKSNGQYIPNPSTWLNQGRWDDEIVSNTINAGGECAVSQHENNEPLQPPVSGIFGNRANRANDTAK